MTMTKRSSHISPMSSNPVQTKMQAKMAKGLAMKEEDKVFRYKGVLYPTIMAPLENLKAVEVLEARHDDVMLAAYPKCGECNSLNVPPHASAVTSSANRVEPLPFRSSVFSTRVRVRECVKCSRPGLRFPDPLRYTLALRAS